MNIIGHDITFFDIQSSKAEQYGFCMDLRNGRKLTCCGDEPLKECGRRYAEGVRWLLHEAFCEDAQEAFFHAHEYFHSTVKEACETAERLGVKNLVLYHSEDVFLEERKRRYLAEGRQYFSGGLYVPDDLEVIELN
jgi:ribonuclease Z